MQRCAELTGAGLCAVLSLPVWSRGEKAGAAFAEEIRQRIAGLARSGSAAPLLNIVTLAHLQSCDLLASCLENLQDDFSVADSALRRRFTAALRGRVAADLAAIESSAVQNGGAVIADFMELPLAHPDALRDAVHRLAMNDLRDRLQDIDIPAGAEPFFASIDGSLLGYFEGFTLYLSWQLKTNDAARRSLLGGKIASLDAVHLAQAGLLTELFDLCADTAAKFDKYLKFPLDKPAAQNAAAAAGDALWWQQPLAVHAGNLIEAVAYEEAIPYGLLASAAAGLCPGPVAPEDADEALAEYASLYQELLSALNAPAPDHPHLQVAALEASAALQQDGADHIEDAFEALAREAQIVAPAALSGQGAAQASGIMLALALYRELRADHQGAAKYYMKALECTPRRADGLVNASLALRLPDCLIRHAQRAQDPVAAEAAGLMAEKVAAALLEKIPRAKHPLAWAAVKTRKALALSALHKIKPAKARAEAAGKELAEARAALPAGAPAPDLLKADIAVCFTLFHSATRTKDKALLRQAVQSLDALQKLPDLTRNRPVWASALHRKALALGDIGADGSDEAAMQTCLECHEAAVAAAAEAGLWLKWPVYQQHFAEAMTRRAQSSKGEGWEDRAVAAFEVALQRCPREQGPALLAGLGDAHFASRTVAAGPKNSLYLAIDAYDLGIEMLTPVTRDDVILQLYRKLAAACAFAGKTDKRDKFLHRSAKAYETAIQHMERTGKPSPWVWSTVQHEYAAGLALLGEQEQDIGILKNAASAFEQAIEARGAMKLPLPLAQSTSGLGEALRKIANLSGDAAIAAQAVRRQEEACEQAKTAGNAAFLSAAEKLLAAAQSTHAELKNGAAAAPGPRPQAAMR